MGTFDCTVQYSVHLCTHHYKRIVVKNTVRGREDNLELSFTSDILLIERALKKGSSFPSVNSNFCHIRICLHLFEIVSLSGWSESIEHKVSVDAWTLSGLERGGSRVGKRRMLGRITTRALSTGARQVIPSPLEMANGQWYLQLLGQLSRSAK